MNLRKIISNGETGVARAALEVAKQLGYQTGGHAPFNYKTEEGYDHSLLDFGLGCTEAQLFPESLRLNISNSDGTVIFTNNLDKLGFNRINSLCSLYNKVFNVNPDEISLITWLEENEIEILNVIGDRLSIDKEHLVVKRVKEILRKVLTK
jgi:hypothetical protein